MDATGKDASKKAKSSRKTSSYSSRPGALVWFFRKSRDQWKDKCKDLKTLVKKFKNRVADLTKSRDKWKLKAEQAAIRIAELNSQLDSIRAENTTLREEITTLKKKEVSSPGSPFAPDQMRPARRHQYPIFIVYLYMYMVLESGSSLRCAAKILSFLGAELGLEQSSPDFSTGRNWLLRLGFWELNRPKEKADDWILMIDHSIQIGTVKCLVILGVRMDRLQFGRALRHEDMELISLEPMTNSNKATVSVCLEEAAQKIGTPRLILTDHGADLQGGVDIFRRKHPETDEVYDIKHKAACLLKSFLMADPQWKKYASKAGITKLSLIQTEMAPLSPANQRSKSRFMNLANLVKWGLNILEIMDNPAHIAKLNFSMEHFLEKLGWLTEFREALDVWMNYHNLISMTIDFVRNRGLYLGAGLDLEKELPESTGKAGELREKLIEFVKRESSKARFGERLPGTTEVLESCFGKLKTLEKDQSKSGFTGMILSLGAIVSKWTIENIREALEQCKGENVLNWISEKIGQTIQSKRKEAFGLLGATKTG